MADANPFDADEVRAQADPLEENPALRQEIESGLKFGHVMLSVNQDQANEAVAYVQALAELLIQKGLIGADELEAPLKRAQEEIGKLLLPRVRLADMGDKYAAGQAVAIDCRSRISLCGARCCTFRFYLTRQDLDEGVIRWDYGNPYWIKQGDDGYCVHCHPVSRACTVHAQRPHTCRQYDCRHDKRVWTDYEARIPAPMPEASGNTPVAMAEVAMHNAQREREGSETSAEDRLQEMPAVSIKGASDA